MTKDRTSSTRRPPRADARRNRERILQVAREVFTRSGGEASLDEMARLAGVGPGTLYRHFPTREDLLKAVYQNEMQKLAEAGKELADKLPPIGALRAWLLLFVDAIAAKQVIGPALNALLGDEKKTFQDSHALVRAALENLVRRAVNAGHFREDVTPEDLLLPLVGVANVAVIRDWQGQAKRLVDILIAGSRPLRESQ